MPKEIDGQTYYYIAKHKIPEDVSVGCIVRISDDGGPAFPCRITKELVTVYELRRLRVYSQWAGNEKGIYEKETQCIATVHGDRDVIGHQCKWKRGHGPNGLYCRKHAKKYEV